MGGCEMTRQQTLSLCSHIEKIVVNVFALDYEDYQDHKGTRHKEFAECRYIVSMMCRKHVESATFSIIGSMLKLKHVAILLGIKKAFQLAEIDASYRQRIERADADIIASGILKARKPAYFLGFTDSIDFSHYNISRAIETIINAEYYLTDINSIIALKTELKTVDGVVFLGGVD
jgi:hypothetical protein